MFDASSLATFPEKLVGVAKTLVGQAERDPEGPVSVVGVGRAGGEIAAGSLAMKRIDKSANKGVIHKNAASRRKSRLAKRLNAAAAAAE